MSKPLITVLLGDPRLPDRSKPGGRFTDDDLDQVARLKRALATLTQWEFEYWNDHETLLQRLVAEPPAFVLNFCDTGFRNDARRELHVAAYLEMLDIPYSGSGPVALGLCYDKSLVRALAAAHAVAVPREVFLRPGEPLPELDYPVFIKPNRADGSVGITTRSLAPDANAARAYTAELWSLLPSADLVVQEFLGGGEFSIGTIGNAETGFDYLPPLEVDYSSLDPSLPRLLDYGSKTDPESPYWRDVRFRQARLEAAALERMQQNCATLFPRLGLRDYARFDFRCDAAGVVKLLEVNPNPAWCWDGKLAHMAQQQGEGHEALLRRIVRAARARCFGESC